jgi:hypothetical protein
MRRPPQVPPAIIDWPAAAPAWSVCRMVQPERDRGQPVLGAGLHCSKSRCCGGYPPPLRAVRRRLHTTMTLQEAKSIARHLGLTLRTVRSGDYRVNFRDGNETTAYYTDDLEDAVNTAVEMARKRGLVE